jgi:multidrug resistance efflux pump
VLERTRALEEGGAVSREALEQARTAYEVARAQHEHASEQLGMVQTGARTERIDAQQAAVRGAEAALAQVEAALSNAIIRAPFAGVVTVRHRQPGEAVAAGAPVLTLMDPDDRWVRIYVREDEVGSVALGQRAQVRAGMDRRRDVCRQGHVHRIAGGVHATQCADRGAAREAGVCRPCRHHGRPAARAEAGHAGGRGVEGGAVTDRRCAARARAPCARPS